MKQLIVLILITVATLISNFEVDAQPSITWQRLYNGQSNTSDNGRGLCESTNGDIFLTGYVLLDRAIVLKLKPNGDTIWTKYFDGIRGDQIISTNDGGCIITGVSSSLLYTMKLDSDGNSVWFKSYANTNSIITTDMIKTMDGGFTICGYQTSVLPAPAFVITLDSLGTMKWQKFFNAGYIKAFYSITETEEFNFVISGLKYECEVCNGYPLLLKLNNTGDSLWEKKYNLFADFKKIYSIEDGYLIGGTILDSPYVFSNTFIMRTNLNGDLIFRKNLIYNNREDLKDMKILNDNKYILACDTDTLDRRNAGVYIIDSSGSIIYRKIFYASSYSTFFSILPLPNRDIVFSGTQFINLGQRRDIFAVRADSTLFAKPLGIHEEFTMNIKNYELYQNYPNPFNPVTKIKYKITAISNQFFQIKIYNSLGQIITSYDINKNRISEILFSGINLPSGVYFYSLIKDNKILQTRKMLYIR